MRCVVYEDAAGRRVPAPASASAQDDDGDAEGGSAAVARGGKKSGAGKAGGGGSGGGDAALHASEGWPKSAETAFEVLQRGYFGLKGPFYGWPVARVRCRPLTGV